MAVDTLTKEFGKPNRLGADWGITSWTISGDIGDGWFIVDNENGTYSYTNRFWDEELDDYNYNDVITVEENNIKELIDYVRKQ